MAEITTIFYNLLIGFILAEILIVIFNGPRSVTPPIFERITKKGHKGKHLTFVILGDSSALSVGGDYRYGYAMKAINHLGGSYQVSMYNLAVSGHTIHEVNKYQLPIASQLVPDLVLIVTGGNDVTMLASRNAIEKAFTEINEKLIGLNCHVKIIATGPPDMGAIIRVPQPLRWFMGFRAKYISGIYKKLIQKFDLTYTPILEKTGPIFRKNHALFALDKFHPNKDGYDTWTPVIIEAIEDAILNQPNHCPKKQAKK